MRSSRNGKLETPQSPAKKVKPLEALDGVAVELEVADAPEPCEAIALTAQAPLAAAANNAIDLVAPARNAGGVVSASAQAPVAVDPNNAIDLVAPAGSGGGAAVAPASPSSNRALFASRQVAQQLERACERYCVKQF